MSNSLLAVDSHPYDIPSSPRPTGRYSFLRDRDSRGESAVRGHAGKPGGTTIEDKRKKGRRRRKKEKVSRTAPAEMRGLGSRGGGGGGIGRHGGGILPHSRRVLDRRSLRLPAAPPRSRLRSSEYGVLGLTPFASPSDVKHAYKRLALKYHPDVIRGETGQDKEETFKEIKSAYESLMVKFEEETAVTSGGCPDHDEWDEWDEWMGFEGGMPLCHAP